MCVVGSAWNVTGVCPCIFMVSSELRGGEPFLIGQSHVNICSLVT